MVTPPGPQGSGVELIAGVVDTLAEVVVEAVVESVVTDGVDVAIAWAVFGSPTRCGLLGAPAARAVLCRGPATERDMPAPPVMGRPPATSCGRGALPARRPCPDSG